MVDEEKRSNINWIVWDSIFKKNVVLELVPNELKIHWNTYFGTPSLSKWWLFRWQKNTVHFRFTSFSTIENPFRVIIWWLILPWQPEPKSITRIPLSADVEDMKSRFLQIKMAFLAIHSLIFQKLFRTGSNGFQISQVFWNPQNLYFWHIRARIAHFCAKCTKLGDL